MQSDLALIYSDTRPGLPRGFFFSLPKTMTSYVLGFSPLKTMTNYALGAVEMAIIPLDDGVDDASTVRACLDGEAGSHFVSLRQYDNEITLAFEEIPLLVEAVEFLKLSADAVEDEDDEDDEDGKPVAKEWPEPSDEFLLDLVPGAILDLLTKPFASEYLWRAFLWEHSPQRSSYWGRIHCEAQPFLQEHKDILSGFLVKRSKLIEEQKKEKEQPAPTEAFLRELNIENVLALIADPSCLSGLGGAFAWCDSPQEDSYWRTIRDSDSPLGKEQLDILRSWLLARFALDGE